MQNPSLVAIAPGLISTLLWGSVVVLAMLACILYYPRRFSGPLTTIERRETRRATRNHSLLATLATPALTITGIALLLPPVVSVHVTSLTIREERPSCSHDTSMHSPFSTRISLEAWTRSALCRARPGAGEEQLAEAIVEAAKDNFPECNSLSEFDTWEIVSVELTLLDLIERSNYVTEVYVDAGPRIHDPDPWDIMSELLEARGISNSDCPRPNAGSMEAFRFGPAAGAGDTPIPRDEGSTVHASDPKLWKRAQEEADKLRAFAADLRKYGLARLDTAERSADFRLSLERSRIVVGKPDRHLDYVKDASSTRLLNLGPFSWSGIQPPRIECSDDEITIHASSRFLDPSQDSFDPTTFFALMRTVSWAARALSDGSCAEPRNPISQDQQRTARPLLSATQIDEAVAGMRRNREAVGLILLALSIFSLALALRRSTS